MFGYQYFSISSVLSLAIGGYWFAIAGTKEFQRFSTIINEKAQAKLKQTMKFNTLFTEFIYAHGIVKQLSIEYDEDFDFHRYQSVV